jgi:type VI secretion system protein ImpA
MATSAVIDVELLLTPISESAPAGTDLRADVSPTSIYYRLSDARSDARAAERRADVEDDTAGPRADWQLILSLAPKALQEQSKDLELTAWLIEGLVRKEHGFAGLRDGLCLARGLLDRYCDTVFPLKDEDGWSTRLAPLAGLNSVLVQPLRKVPVTKPHGDHGAFAIYHYEQAWALSRVANSDARARREAAGEIRLELFTAAVNASGGQYYISLLEDIEASLHELALLTDLLVERAASESPSVSEIASVLTSIRDMVSSFSSDLVAREKAAVAATASGTGNAADGAAQGELMRSNGTMRGREDALRTLLQVADYFKDSEPNSPISASLEETVRRARMPFAELLAELLPDVTAWRSVLTGAGIKPPSAG